MNKIVFNTLREKGTKTVPLVAENISDNLSMHFF